MRAFDYQKRLEEIQRYGTGSRRVACVTSQAACQRECLEELGIRLTIGRLLVLEHQMEAPPFGDSIMFIYDGGAMPDGTRIVLRAGELRSHRFVPAARVGELTSDRLSRRIHFALQALREGSTIELTHGVRAH